MKIDVEVKVHGAVTAQQADTILLFTRGISAKNTAYLDEIDDPNPADHSSLCMVRSPYNGKCIVAHWQTGFESFPQNGRFYCTRAIYEMPFDKVECSDYSSLIGALPRLEHFSVKKFDVDPVLINVAENKSGSAKADDVQKYIWISIAAGKRLFIRLDKSEDCYANALLESSRLHSLLRALNALPVAVRRMVSFGYSLKWTDAVKTKDSLFGGLSIVAYYLSEGRQDIPADCISVAWTGQSLLPDADYSKYEKDAKELQEVAVAVAPETQWSNWKQMCDGISQKRAEVDKALAAQNREVLSYVFGKQCPYRKSEVKSSLLDIIANQTSPTVEDIRFLAVYAAKSGMERYLGKWLKSSHVAKVVKLEIQSKFAECQVVIDALKGISASLPLKERFVEFGSPLCSLSYSDLALDKASDNDFLEIYEGLLARKYEKVDVSQIPNSASFPLKYVKILIARNNDAVVEKSFRKIVTDHKLADESFLKWLLEKRYLRTPKQLIAWTRCLNKALIPGLVDKFVEANSKFLTCVDLLKLRLQSNLSFSYKQYLGECDLPLGELSLLCNGLTDEQKNLAYCLLEDRKISTLEEWEEMQSAFGKSGTSLNDDLLVGETGAILDTLIRFYQLYQSDDNVRGYVEKKVLSLAEEHPEDKSVKKTISEMCKVNKDFKNRMKQSPMAAIKEFMYSHTGLKVSWGLNVFFVAIVIVMLSMRGCSQEEHIGGHTQNDTTVLPEDMLQGYPVDTLGSTSGTLLRSVADSTANNLKH